MEGVGWRRGGRRRGWGGESGCDGRRDWVEGVGWRGDGVERSGCDGRWDWVERGGMEKGMGWREWM